MFPFPQIDWKLPPESKAEVEGYILKFRRQDRQWKDPIKIQPDQNSYTITNLGKRTVELTGFKYFCVVLWSSLFMYLNTELKERC